MDEVLEETRKNNEKNVEDYERKILQIKESYQERINDTMIQNEKIQAQQHALQKVKSIQGIESTENSLFEIKQMLKSIQETVASEKSVS